ncbi:hypothetical protein NF859_10605, partial [Thermococcus alcaliphilus]|nr:hypothetical protein [Thermococcus alcaliphilus]
DALSREPTRYKILFVGGGKSVGELQKIVRTRYPELDVEFVGSIDYKLIANYYRLCDVVFAWYPPRENVKRAIAVKVLEACSLGVISFPHDVHTGIVSAISNHLLRNEVFLLS